MRLNKFVASSLGISRRGADELISRGRVLIDGKFAVLGQQVEAGQEIVVDDKRLTAVEKSTHITIALNKPAGYVCSRARQGSAPTIYELLPEDLHHLKPVGRLDKDSSGLLLLTTDGDLAYQLTHPKFAKEKRYQVELDRLLKRDDLLAIEKGIRLDDGLSRLRLSQQGSSGKQLEIHMSEGRNRQIRRTFEAIGYRVVKLHRTHFGPYLLGGLPSGSHLTSK